MALASVIRQNLRRRARPKTPTKSSAEAQEGAGVSLTGLASARMVVGRLMANRAHDEEQARHALRMSHTKRTAADVAALSRVLRRLKFFRAVGPDALTELSRVAGFQSLSEGEVGAYPNNSGP